MTRRWAERPRRRRSPDAPTPDPTRLGCSACPTSPTSSRPTTSAGSCPTSSTPDVARALGAAFAEVVAVPDGADGVVIGHDMRRARPSCQPAFADGVTSPGVDVTLIGLCSTDGLYYASGALDLPGAMFTASHNPAQYNGIKLCRSGARPVGQDTGLAEIRDLAAVRCSTAARGLARAGRRGPGPSTSATCSPTTPPSCAASSTSPASRPLKVVVDAGNGMGGHTVPAVLGTGAGPGPAAARDRPALLRARRHVPQPRGQPARPREPRRPAGGRPSSTAPTSASPSTATPTAASSSTSAASRSAPAPSRRWSPPARSPARSPPARRPPTSQSSTTSSRSAAVPEIIAEHGARGGAHPRRPLVHQGRDGPRRTPCSAASTAPTTTSATSGSPTPACSRRCTSSPPSASRTQPLSELTRRRTSRYAASGEINSTVTDAPAATATGPRVGRSAGRASSTSSTGSP